jgi:hypothetical protein
MGNVSEPFTLSPSAGAAGTESVQRAAIFRLAHATIGLSQLAPRLSTLATTRQAESERQAERVRDIATMAREMASVLEQTVRQLRLSSGEIGELSTLIRRIADETRLIAINTGIAAARAGEEGRVFTVLAKEIRLLSENAAVATQDVQSKVGRLQESALRTSQTVGLEQPSGEFGTAEAKSGLGWLLERMDEADSSATQQAGEARELNALGTNLRDISEQMIHAVGAFRMEAHARVEQLVEKLRNDPGMRSADPARQTRALQSVVESCPFVELAYATDIRGLQATENISSRAFRAAYGVSGKHQNWSQRPWFRGALQTPAVYLSEIYRSAATDEFCFTASATVADGKGAPVSVVALDVNFRAILGRETQ